MRPSYKIANDEAWKAEVESDHEGNGPWYPSAFNELRRRAEALLQAGTLVHAPGETVAYAFVVPIELRDALADALADIDVAENP